MTSLPVARRVSWCLLCGVVLLPSVANAQLRQRVEATRARNYLFIELRNTGDGTRQPFFGVDTRAEDKLHPLRQRLTVSTSPSTGLNIQIGFLNPLLYSWSTTETSSDDPTYTSAKAFLESAGKLLNLVGVAAAVPLPPPPEGAPGAPVRPDISQVRSGRVAQSIPVPGSTGAPDPERLNVPEYYSPALQEWSQWVVLRTACLAQDRNAWQTLVDHLGEADRQLYGDKAGAAETRSGAQFRTTVRSVVTALTGATTIPTLRTASASAAESLAIIRKSTSSAEAAVTSARSSVAALAVGAGNGCSNLLDYTKNVVASYADAGVAKVAERGQLAADLSTLGTRVSTLLASRRTHGADLPGEDYFPITNIALPEGTVRDVTVSIRQQSVTTSGTGVTVVDHGNTQVSFRVMEHKSVEIEFAPGVALTSLRYPSYGTSPADGQVLVTRNADDVQRTVVTGMLNIVSTRQRGPIYPIAQLGIGTGPEYPVLMAGGGVRLVGGTQLSLTAGAAWAFVRELSGVTLGQAIASPDALEDHLDTRLRTRPQLYIGAQRSF
jgi:hypothetical protein